MACCQHSGEYNVHSVKGQVQSAFGSRMLRWEVNTVQQRVQTLGHLNSAFCSNATEINGLVPEVSFASKSTDFRTKGLISLLSF